MIPKNNLKQTLDRLLAFSEYQLGGGILASVYCASEEEAEQPALDPGRTGQRECLLLEDIQGCFRRATSGWNPTNCLTDDIPRVYPTSNFGESIWSGMLGGKIVFAGNSIHTWSHCPEPVIRSSEIFDFPEVKKDNFWFCKMLEATKYFVDRLEPVCDIQHFIFMDCLNLLMELRGAAAYTDLYDSPDFVGKFMKWSVKENIRVFEAQASLSREFVKKVFGDHPFCKYARCNIPDISIDAYAMARTEAYELFGLEQHRGIAEYYGGARLHIHSNGQRLCKLAAKIEKIIECQFTDDVGYQNPYEIAEELKEAIYPIPVSFNIPKDIFVEKLTKRTLPGDVKYYVTGAFSGPTEANEIMRKVFDYRA